MGRDIGLLLGAVPVRCALEGHDQSRCLGRHRNGSYRQVTLMVLNIIGGILPPWVSPPFIGSLAMVLAHYHAHRKRTFQKFDAAHIERVFGTDEPAPAVAEETAAV